MTAQNMGKKILSEAGYDVVAVSNGAAAVKKIAEQKPDIIILDIMLPGFDGFEVCRQFRQQRLEFPVLMLTGLGDESDRIVGLEMGADDYLPKTFSTRELLARLRAVIRRSRVTAARSFQCPAV